MSPFSHFIRVYSIRSNSMQLDFDRSDEDITRAVEQHADMLFRICLVQLGNVYDAEDGVQETFVRYLTKAPLFAETEHEKAWLIRVATNICRDIQRFKSRHPWIEISELEDYCSHEEDIGILNMVMTLPAIYKTVIHLYYVEGYNTESISGILNISNAAVKKRMQRGRSMLHLVCEKEEVLI